MEINMANRDSASLFWNRIDARGNKTVNYYIDAIEYYLPARTIDNRALSELHGISGDFLENKVGIKIRHISAEDESTSDMASRAVQKLLKARMLDPSEIDLLLLCTQNPDYRLPTTACLVQDKLGLKKSCISFDINLGCSGFTYALPIAGNFIKAGMIKNAVAVMADQYSKIIDYNDKNTAALFGDAASAALLKSCDDGHGVLDVHFGSDGSGALHLVAYNSGTKKNVTENHFLYMNGREIYNFSIQVVPRSVEAILARNHLNISDIRYFVFHQANKFMLSEIKAKLKISDEQMVFDMENYGNTVSSTIPIALKNLMDKGRIKKNDLIILCGFGVGLSWATVIYKNP